jgi:hypothetical protein
MADNKIATGSPWALFETDAALERSGIKLDYGAFHFQVARAGGANDRYGTVLRQKMAPHRRALQTDTLPEKLSQRLVAETMAETVVIGWGSEMHGEGKMVGRDGSAIDFTAENVVALLLELPGLAKDVLDQASNEALFLTVLAERDAGN